MDIIQKNFSKEYNTQQPDIKLKEYGRNIQKLVNYIENLEAEEDKLKYANTLAKLMKQLNPNIKDSEDYKPKIWNHMYYIADTDMTIDNAPYERPEQFIYNSEPRPLEYNNNRLRFKHYGKNIELLIAETVKQEDAEQRERSIIYIGKLMKKFYGTWNKENVDDAVIVEQIKSLSKNQLDIDVERVKEEKLFDGFAKEHHHHNQHTSNNNHGKNHKRPKRRNYKK